MPINQVKFALGVPNNTTFDFTLSQLIFSGEYIVGLQATKVFKEISVNSLQKQKLLPGRLLRDLLSLPGPCESLRVLNESMASVEQTYNEALK